MSWFGMWDGFDDECQEAPDLFAQKPQTNADLIRAMSDDELAKRLSKQDWWNCPPNTKSNGGCMGTGCYNCWLDWLKQEASE